MNEALPDEAPMSSIQEVIAELAESQTPAFDAQAIQRLAAFGPAVVQPLIEAVKAGPPGLRANAALALGTIGDGQEMVVETLSNAWLDSDRKVSMAGQMALWRLPHPTEPKLMKRVHAGVGAKLREIMQDIIQQREGRE